MTWIAPALNFLACTFMVLTGVIYWRVYKAQQMRIMQLEMMVGHILDNLSMHMEIAKQMKEEQNQHH